MRSATNNKEITNLMIALGLKLQNSGRSEQDRLRYGSIVIMTDQDPDGSHIKGLVVAMLAKYYPKGLRRRGFVKIFHTPIVRATCGSEVKDFYSQPEADAWIAAREGRRVHVKYYNGLGRWTHKDADAMAGRLQQHLVPMDAATPDDISAIEQAFGPDSSFRRDLVNSVPSLPPLDPRSVSSWRGFVHTELSRFFHYDNARSIPGFDGLKISQRKIIQAVLDQPFHYREAGRAVRKWPNSSAECPSAWPTTTERRSESGESGADFPGLTTYPSVSRRPVRHGGTGRKGPRCQPIHLYDGPALSESTVS